MNRHLIQAAEGALGAAAGTYFMRKSMGVMGKLPADFQPAELKGDPAEYIVSRAERIAGRALPERYHERAKKSAAWIYGAGWGVLLGALAPAIDFRSPGRALAAGAALGAGVWAAGYAGWLPRAGLVDPFKRQSPKRAIAPLLIHMIYGVFAALPICLLERWREPRRTRWQRLARRFT